MSKSMHFRAVQGIVSAVGVACAASAATASFTFVQIPPVVFPGPHFPTMTVGGDLDGDGLPDLVSPGRDPKGLVHVLRNMGDGVVEIHQTLELGGMTDWAALGDLDGDGTLDVALAIRNGPRGLAVHLGNGDGTFDTAGAFYGGSRDLRCVELADLNNDGDLDAVAVDYEAHVLRIYRNAGNGVLAPDAPIRLVAHQGGFVNAANVAVADLDGDGFKDVVVTATGAGRIIQMRNRGDGTFETAINRRVPPINGYQPGLINTVLVDVDGDGAIDLVSPWIMGFLTQLIGVLPNDGDGNFDQVLSSEGVYAAASFYGAAADLDGDGKPDAIVGHALPGVIGISRNLGGFAFDAPQIIPLCVFVRHILPIDMNGDGTIDIVAVDAPEHILSVLLNVTPPPDGGSAEVGEAVAAAAARGGTLPATTTNAERRNRPAPERADVGIPKDSADGRDIGLWLQERP